MTTPAARLDIRPMWGTTIRIEVCDPFTERALDPIWEWFQHVDDVFSTWRDDSEISMLARGELLLDAASPEVADVLARCQELTRASAGAFDVSFAAATDTAHEPGRCAIDPTGVVKGWAVDRAVTLLASRGAENFSINAGGDIAVRGHPRAGAVWRVGIQHPWQRSRTAAVVGLTDAAVATSGGYERDGHVVDARTGRPARGLASVTVVGRDLARADGCATAALALGPDGMPWLATLPDVAAMGITDDHRVLKTAGFDSFTVE